MTVYNGNSRRHRPKMLRAHERVELDRVVYGNIKRSWLTDMSNRLIIYCMQHELYNVAVDWMVSSTFK